MGSMFPSDGLMAVPATRLTLLCVPAMWRGHVTFSYYAFDLPPLVAMNAVFDSVVGRLPLPDEWGKLCFLRVLACPLGLGLLLGPIIPSPISCLLGEAPL